MIDVGVVVAVARLVAELDREMSSLTYEQVDW